MLLASYLLGFVSVLSLWTRAKPLSLGFYVCSFLCLLLSSRGEFISLGTLFIYVLLAYKTKQNIRLTPVLFLLSLFGLSHLFPGFEIIRIESHEPYYVTYYFHFMMMCFVNLYFAKNLIKNHELKAAVLIFLRHAALTVGTLICLATVVGYLKFNFKIPPKEILGLIFLHILLIACAEEFVFRYHLQTYLEKVTQKRFLGLLLASIIFGVLHFPKGVEFSILASVAGLFYGYAYQKSKKIEVSIVIHFLVNVLALILK